MDYQTKQTTITASNGGEVMTESLNLYQKLLEIQKSITAIPKDTKGYNFSYQSPDKVLGMVKPLMNEHGLLLVPSVKSEKITTDRLTNSKGKVETLYNVPMVFTWIDCETGQKLDVEWFGAGINNDEQGYGSALSYAERYFFLKYFHIATSEDDPDYLSKDRLNKKISSKKQETTVVEESMKLTTSEMDKIAPSAHQKFIKDKCKEGLGGLAGKLKIKIGEATVGQYLDFMKEVKEMDNLQQVNKDPLAV